jgi:hypothetical protein
MEDLMRRLDLRFVAALGAVVLLGGAAVWPAASLASTGEGATATVDQSIGYRGVADGPWDWGWPDYANAASGPGGASWAVNNYPGSGVAAWVGASAVSPVGWGWPGSAYLANGYRGPATWGSSSPGSGYVYYPAGNNNTYRESATYFGSPDAASIYGTYGRYYAPLLCTYAGSC